MSDVCLSKATVNRGHYLDDEGHWTDTSSTEYTVTISGNKAIKKLTDYFAILIDDLLVLEKEYKADVLVAERQEDIRFKEAALAYSAALEKYSNLPWWKVMFADKPIMPRRTRIINSDLIHSQIALDKLLIASVGLNRLDPEFGSYCAINRDSVPFEYVIMTTKFDGFSKVHLKEIIRQLNSRTR